MVVRTPHSLRTIGIYCDCDVLPLRVPIPGNARLTTAGYRLATAWLPPNGRELLTQYVHSRYRACSLPSVARTTVKYRACR